MKLSVILAVLGCATCTVAINGTFYIENANYKGHYLSATNLPTGLVNVTNPPLGEQHKWIMDWDLAFLNSGSIVTSSLSKGFISTGSTLETGQLTQIATSTGHNWRISYRNVGIERLYKIDAVLAAGASACMWDNGMIPVLTIQANCTTENLKGWWKIYTV